MYDRSGRNNQNGIFLNANLCPKFMCFIYLYRLWIYLNNMVKLTNFCRLFFYQMSTFHCPCLTADHIGTSVLGEIMHLSIGLMIYNVSLLSTTAIVTFVKTNDDRRSLSLPDCRSGRDICVLGETMHLFIGLMVSNVTLLSTTALVTS